MKTPQNIRKEERKVIILTIIITLCVIGLYFLSPLYAGITYIAALFLGFIFRKEWPHLGGAMFIIYTAINIFVFPAIGWGIIFVLLLGTNTIALIIATIAVIYQYWIWIEFMANS